MNYQTLTRLLSPKLYDAIQPYRVVREEDVPWAYSKLNPEGRPYQNDWGIMREKLPPWMPGWGKDIVGWLQPWQKRERKLNMYKVPLPYRIAYGATEKSPHLYDGIYPLARDTQRENRLVWHDFTGTPKTVFLPHFIADRAPADYTGLTIFEGFIGGEWRRCFVQYQAILKKKADKMLRFLAYAGLKQDLTVSFFEDERLKSDMIAMWFEASMSCKWMDRQ